MNKNRQGAKGSGVAGKLFDCDGTGKKSNTELLDEITEMMDCESEDEMDVEAIERKLALLQERVPVSMDHTPSEFLESMVEKHPLLFEVSKSEETAETREPAEKIGRKHPCRFLRRFVGVAAAMLCLVIAASALGMKPVSSFLEWAEGVIFIYNHPSGTMEIPDSDIAEYHTLEEALVANGINSSLCPRWIPEDYTLSGIDVVEQDYIFHCTAAYESERGELFIRVDSFSNEAWGASSEYDGSGYEYENNGIRFYITSNANLMKAGWQNGTYSYLINGQVSENELIFMINSVKGEND